MSTHVDPDHVHAPKSKNNNHLVFVSTHTIVGLVPCSGSLFRLISILCISPKIFCFVRPATNEIYWPLICLYYKIQINLTQFQMKSSDICQLSRNHGPVFRRNHILKQNMISIGYPPCLGIVLEKLESGDSVTTWTDRSLGFKLSWALKVNSGSVHFWKMPFINLWVEFEK